MLAAALLAGCAGTAERRDARSDPRPLATVPVSLADPAAEPEAIAEPEVPSGPVPPVIRVPIDVEEAIDAAVTQGIARGGMPGAVVVIGRRDGVVFRRAYGERAIVPEPVPMTIDTVFDLASLTKAIVTTTAIAMLVEQGRIELDAPVARHLPAFAANGKGAITVEQLLTHTAGLPAINPLTDYADGRARAIERVLSVAPAHRPGSRYAYSDLGFIVLGALVEAVAGEPLDTYARERIFEPLGMSETTYRPDGELRARCAPTEISEHRDPQLIHGECHDPRAWRLDGVAGNAGLFSTADDLARFARAMLGGGALDGARIARAETLGRFTEPRQVGRTHRALGWNAEADGSYGHGGFTGTSLWIDPESDLFVLFLSNRVHPNGRGNVHPTVRAVRRIAEAAVPRIAPAPPDGARVLAGVDVLRRDGFARLDGARVALITNASGRARDGMRTIDLLHEAPNVRLVSILAPEHGLDASREGHIGGGRDARTDLPVHSLFNETRRPTAHQLEGADAIVFDLQDVGVRFYTYASTMLRAMEAAAEHDLRFVVLDRPNPLGGERVEGPVLDDDEALASFVNFHPLPIRHGLTLGELAALLNEERDVGARLEIVPVEGWTRASYYDETGLRWVPPSPNLGTVEQVVLYPALALLEGTNVSVGRGTDDAFRVIGAPFLDASALVARLRAEPLVGVTFEPTTFAPRVGPYRRQRCRGVRLTVTDRDAYRPVLTGLALARALQAEHAQRWNPERLVRMVGDHAVSEAVLAGAELPALEALWREELDAFRTRARR